MDSLKLTETEKKIIDNRLSGKSFSELSGNDRQHYLDQIIGRVAAQTGCDLPKTDFFANILCQELEGVIVDFGYSELTLNEVIFSIRLNSSPSSMRMPSGIELDSIPFTGRMANGYFLSRVLSNYMVLRNMFDRKLQNFIDGY